MITDNPLEFMRNNVVRVGSFDRSGLFWARLDGSNGVYTVVNANGAGEGHFPIYWCHYTSDNIHIIALQDQANLMFTPRMSGCTFGVGIPASDGTVVVGHANIQEGKGYRAISDIDKALGNKKLSFQESLKLKDIRNDLVMQEQRQLLEDSFGPIGMATHLDWRTEAYATASEITTFGVRNERTNQWDFYFQARKGNSKGSVKGVYQF